MKAIVISVGDELLSGRTLNTNLKIISEFLRDLGMEILRNCTVRDDQEEISRAIQESMRDADITIVTGGLGITPDDVTREAVAKALNRSLVFDPDLYSEIEKKMVERGVKITELHKKYGLVPEGFGIVKNDTGLAPGYYTRIDGKLILVLPGPPHELENVLKNASFLFEKREEIVTKTVKTFGLKESDIAERLRDVMDILSPMGSYPVVPGMVDLKLILKGPDREKLEEELNRKLKILEQRIGDAIYGYDDDTLQSVLGRILRENSMTVAVAESCTGGLVASLITDVPGSSDYFKGGVVSYWNEVKRDILGVGEEILNYFGAVSEPTAVMMAEGVRKLLKTDVGLATTGIAGPTGGTPEKPVGLVYMAVSFRGDVTVKKKVFKGDRLFVKKQAAYTILDLARRKILECTK